MLNVHHLELFYYVARCEGIVAACRQIPYGIQQPAVSAQVARLEEDLGVRLFERRPFRLTPAGKALYDFIAPFFGRLNEVEDIVKGKMSRVIRLAGFTEAMREHVPVLLAKLRERFPGLKVTLQEIDQRGAEHLIAQGDADLAIMVLESKLPPGFRSVTLARLPLCLLVRADQPYRRAADLLKEGAAGKVPVDQSAAARIAAPAIPKGNGPPEHCLENRDGDKFAGFCVHSTCATDSAPDLRCRRRSCSAIPDCACCR